MNKFEVAATGSLYIANLHPDVTEGKLYEKFSSIGKILPVKIARDSITQQSMCFGYINFYKTEDAERALQALDNDEIDGRPIRIMWSEKGLKMRSCAGTNLIVGNLAEDIDNRIMYEKLSVFGILLSCKVKIGNDGRSKCFGFVHFEKQEAAHKVMKEVNGTFWNGQKVFIRKSVRRTPGETIFVKELSDDITEGRLSLMFKKFGEINTSVIIKNPDGTSKGFGFVVFFDNTCVDAAIEEMNGIQINGKFLYVERYKTKEERINETKMKLEKVRDLYVTNLDRSINEHQLRDKFAPYGIITKATVMTEGGLSKGCAFVSYTSMEAATKAISELNGQVLGKKPIYVSFANSKKHRPYVGHNIRTDEFTNNVFCDEPIPEALCDEQIPEAFCDEQIPGALCDEQIPGALCDEQIPEALCDEQIPGALCDELCDEQIPGAFCDKQIPEEQPPLVPYSNPSIPSTNFINFNNNGDLNPLMNFTFGTRDLPINVEEITFGNACPPFGTPFCSVCNDVILSANRDVTFSSEDNVRLDITSLAKAAPLTQKRVLGKILFKIIEKHYPHIAGIIVEMLLEMDNADLVLLIEDKDILQIKVNEAIAALNAHQVAMIKD